jgi:hypothetical protein
MANVLIDIAAEFTGNKAFKQADSATDKLTKNVKQLAATFGLAFGTAQVIAYGKASVKAAAADQKAQQQLALALKNVGLGRDAASSEAYIQRLQSEFGIVDDLLRPAYQTLAVATGDTAEAQRLLNLSLDISASTGKELGSVTAALSRAYLGNNAALSRLGVGISKADLKAKSFEEITSQLTTTFAGSATAAANTFQGSIDKLGVAAANTQEIIGTGLIDALQSLGDQNSVDDLAESMESAALYTADVIRGVGVLTQKLQSLPGAGSFNIGMIPIVGSYLEILRGLGKQSTVKPFTTPMTISGQSQQSTKITKEQTKLSKENLKVSKEQLKLSKAKAIFDLQKIQIEAALKGKLSEEDRIRLLLMKAIENENISDIEKYTKMLTEAQNKAKELQDILDKVKNTSFASLEDTFPEDLFKSFRESAARAGTSVEEIIAKVQALTGVILSNQIAMTSFAQGINAGLPTAEALSGARYAAQGAAKAGLGTTPTPPPSNEPIGALPETGSPTRRGGGVGGVTPLSINVNVGGTIISEGGLIDAITNAIYQQQKNGKAIVYNSTSI